MKTGLMAVISADGYYYKGCNKGTAVWTRARCEAKWTSRTGATRIMNKYQDEERPLSLVSINY